MRALKVLVVVMGVLIVVGTVTLVVLIVQRAGRVGAGDGMAGTVALRQPPGSRIAGVAAVEGRVAVWVERPDGGRVLLVDPQRMRVVGEIVTGE